MPAGCRLGLHPSKFTIKASSQPLPPPLCRRRRPCAAAAAPVQPPPPLCSRRRPSLALEPTTPRDLCPSATRRIPQPHGASLSHTAHPSATTRRHAAVQVPNNFLDFAACIPTKQVGNWYKLLASHPHRILVLNYLLLQPSKYKWYCACATRRRVHLADSCDSNAAQLRNPFCF